MVLNDTDVKQMFEDEVLMLKTTLMNEILRRKHEIDQPRTKEVAVQELVAKYKKEK